MSCIRKLAYIALGGMIAVATMMIDSRVSTSSTELPEIQELIMCRELAIVNNENAVVGYLASDKYGGIIHVVGTEGKPVVFLSADEDGGNVRITGPLMEDAVSLTVGTDGGSVSVHAKPDTGRGYGSLGIYGTGGGILLTDNSGSSSVLP